MIDKITHFILRNDPVIQVRAVLPYQKVEDKNKKQFITTKDTKLTITFADNNKLNISIKAGFEYDGASIPFNIGKGDMRLLIPALFHDYLCEHKQIVNYNRNLSSIIFRELLIACDIDKLIARDMYIAVDNYQKLFVNWEKPND
jgi:hypothetical protein